MAVGRINVGGGKKAEVFLSGFGESTRYIVAIKGDKVASAIGKTQYLHDNKGNLLKTENSQSVFAMSNTEYYTLYNSGNNIYDWGDNLVLAGTNLASTLNDGQRTFKRMDNGDFVCFKHTTSRNPTVYDHNENLLATATKNLLNDSKANVFSFIGLNGVLCLYTKSSDNVYSLMYYNHKTNTIEEGKTGNSKILMPVLQV